MSNLWLHPLFDIRDTHILQAHTIITCKSTHALQNKCSVLDHYFNCWRVIEVWKSLSESNSGDSRAILFVPEGGRLASCVWARWVFVAFPKVSFHSSWEWWSTHNLNSWEWWSTHNLKASVVFSIILFILSCLQFLVNLDPFKFCLQVIHPDLKSTTTHLKFKLKQFLKCINQLGNTDWMLWNNNNNNIYIYIYKYEAINYKLLLKSLGFLHLFSKKSPMCTKAAFIWSNYSKCNHLNSCFLF